jgi:hypothetical protein
VRYRDRKNAAGQVIRRGAVKRTKYPPVDLRKRRVLIGLHQTGVNRTEGRVAAPKITAHRVIGPSGVRYRVHPLTTQLDAIDRLNRAPWQTINIEVSGNFERIDGKGNWYKPELLGRGRASAEQIESARQDVAAIIAEVTELGGRVEAIVPHCVSGADDRGIPNRHACPGSWVWSQVGEWAAMRYGLAVPGPGVTFGGVPIDDRWHGEFWDAIVANGGPFLVR